MCFIYKLDSIYFMPWTVNWNYSGTRRS